MKHLKLWVGLGVTAALLGGAALALFGPWAKHTNPIWVVLKAGAVSAKQVQSEGAAIEQTLGLGVSELAQGTTDAQFDLTLDSAEGEGVLLWKFLTGAKAAGHLALDVQRQELAASASVSLAEQPLFDLALAAEGNVGAVQSDLLTGGEMLGAHTETLFRDYNASVFGQNKGIDTAKQGFEPWQVLSVLPLARAETLQLSAWQVGLGLAKALWDGGLHWSGPEEYGVNGTETLSCEAFTASWSAAEVAALLEQQADALEPTLTAQGMDAKALEPLRTLARRLDGTVNLKLYLNSGRLMGAVLEAKLAADGTDTAEQAGSTADSAEALESVLIQLQLGVGGKSVLTGCMAAAYTVTEPDGNTRRSMLVTLRSRDTEQKQYREASRYTTEENGAEVFTIGLEISASPVQSGTADDSAPAALNIDVTRISAAWQTEQGTQSAEASGRVVLTTDTGSDVETGITETLRFPFEESAEQQTALQRTILKSMLTQVWQKPALRTVLWDYALQRAAEVFSTADLAAIAPWLFPNAGGSSAEGGAGLAGAWNEGAVSGALEKLQELWSGLAGLWSANAAG